MTRFAETYTEEMPIPDNLLCLFNSRVDAQNDSFVIEVPEREVSVGAIEPGESYRVAILSTGTGAADRTGRSPDRDRGVPAPPVDAGETVEVEIEDIGEQGDGIARIDRGYIVFVPDTNIGDRVTVEISDVRENFAFGDVIEGPY